MMMLSVISCILSRNVRFPWFFSDCLQQYWICFTCNLVGHEPGFSWFLCARCKSCTIWTLAGPVQKLQAHRGTVCLHLLFEPLRHPYYDSCFVPSFVFWIQFSKYVKVLSSTITGPPEVHPEHSPSIRQVAWRAQWANQHLPGPVEIPLLDHPGLVRQISRFTSSLCLFCE